MTDLHNARLADGKARPAAIVKNTRMISEGGCANAKPRAMLKNGAVQGVANIVARTPFKKAPDAPCFDARAPAVPVIRLAVTSKIPNRFRATNVTNTVSTT